jgi:DNA-binding HxlR family transcriptional regulator
MTKPRAETPQGRTAPAADPGPPGRPHTRTKDARVLVDAALLDLIRRPYLAEILAALDQQPHTLATLRHTTHAPRRQTVATLRALAGHHAITRLPATGSWDTTSDKHVQYRLTTAGHDLIGRLFDPQLWAALYQDNRSSAPSDPG